MKLTNEKFQLELDPKETIWVIFLVMFLYIIKNPDIFNISGLKELLVMIWPIISNH